MKLDKDIRKAKTLSTDVYSSAFIYRESLEKVFACSWQPIEITPSDTDNVTPVFLLEGSMDEPLILVRSQDGIACFSNVCTHRGNIIVTEPGHYGQLTCGYHGKCFDLSGRFKSMPGFEEALDFPSENDHLPRLELNHLGPIPFTSIEPAYSWGDWIRPLRERLSWFDFDALKLHFDLSNTFRLKAHWALYCENYLEGFHIPFVHEKLNKVLKYTDYTTDLYSLSNVQLGVAREGEKTFDIPKGHPDHGKDIYAYYWWIFPNIMINVYTWGVSLNIVKPLGLDATEIVFKSYLLPGAKPDKVISDDLYETEMEDEEIVLQVQRGVRSRLYSHGRFSPSMEKGVHHFQRLLSQFLTRT